MKNKLIALSLIPLIANATDELTGFHIVKSNKPLMIERSFGSIETHEKDDYIKFFFNINKSYKKELKYSSSKYQPKYAQNSIVLDTGLKSSVQEIKLSIPYTEPKELLNRSFAYAPIGSYKDGWTGIKTFFKDSTLGICSYSFEKYIYIEAESNYVKKLVNDKPSFASIKGNIEAGYLYTLSWNIDKKDYVYDHKIECVNIKNNEIIMDNMIELAKNFDK